MAHPRETEENATPLQEIKKKRVGPRLTRFVDRTIKYFNTTENDASTIISLGTAASKTIKDTMEISGFSIEQIYSMVKKDSSFYAREIAKKEKVVRESGINPGAIVFVCTANLIRDEAIRRNPELEAEEKTRIRQNSCK